MQKWEYYIEVIKESPSYTEGNSESNSRSLTRHYGKRGWELVSVDNGVAYFKRPVEMEKVPAPNPEMFGKFTSVGRPLDDTNFKRPTRKEDESP